MTDLVAPPPRRADDLRLRRLWRRFGRRLAPLVDAVAIAWAIIGQSLRPLTWRRPVRAEFVRFFDIAILKTLSTVVGAGLLIGFVLIAQALYWLERTGEQELVQSVLTVVVIREIAPFVAALLVLGRGGLMLMSDLERTVRSGAWRTLDRQGVDPFLLLIVPRAVALGIGCFCLTIVFILAAFTSGYLAARTIGIETLPLGEFVLFVLHSIGATGYLVLPVKTMLTGLAIGVIGSVTALDLGNDRHRVAGSRISSGFLRAMITIFVISGLVTGLGL